MKVLAADTALGACSAALLADGAILARRYVAMERGHAEALAPMVDEVMREARTEFGEIDRLGVTVGPGTFTGQRVGLAFMRALRVALKRPLVGVTSLAAMVAQALDETNAAMAAAIHEARRDEVYLEIGTRAGPVQAAVLLARDVAHSRIASLAAGQRIALAGTGAESALRALAARNVDAAMTSVTAPDAVWVARLAAAAPTPDGPPKPLYLREPDAKLPGRPK